MARLASDARSLVDAGRQALRPTSGDRQRVLEALQARVGVGAGASAGGAAPPAAAAGGFSWPVMAVVAIGLGIGGGVVFQTFEGGPTRAPAIAVTTKAPAAAAPAPEVTAPAPAAPAGAAPPAPISTEARNPGQRGPGRLAAEVEILSRAQTELHAGRFASSLRLLDEHARRFPRGALAQERVAARIQALCGAGRRSETNAELARLTPGSLHEARAREACTLGAQK